MLCWLLLGSLVLNRLFFNQMLPPPLVPTLAIELAPPAVAGVAWFAMNGGTIDLPARVLGGYAVLMALVQLRFLPVYRRLHFSPGFWAFTFSYTAAAGGVAFQADLAHHPGLGHDHGVQGRVGSSGDGTVAPGQRGDHDGRQRRDQRHGEQRLEALDVHPGDPPQPRPASVTCGPPAQDRQLPGLVG